MDNAFDDECLAREWLDPIEKELGIYDKEYVEQIHGKLHDFFDSFSEDEYSYKAERIWTLCVDFGKKLVEEHKHLLVEDSEISKMKEHFNALP